MTAAVPTGPTDAQAEPFDRDGYDARRAWRRPTTTVVEDRAFEAGWFAAKASPAVRAALDAQEVVTAVRELHSRDATEPHACDYCGQAWPCDVIHALDTRGEPS